MQAVEPDVSKPFPANGKIVVRYGGMIAEALLELPAPSTRVGAAELPAVVWLTAGLLATDSFALQVCSWSCLLRLYIFTSLFGSTPLINQYNVSALRSIRITV